MRYLILLPLMLFCFSPGKSQISVNYYYDGNTVGISADPVNKHWWELRMNTYSYRQTNWSYSERGIIQAYYCRKIFSEQKVDLYAGIGPGAPIFKEDFDWFSINIPIGLQINPFDKLPAFYIVGEYNPMIVIEDGLDLINAVSIGFKYAIRWKKKSQAE